MKIANIQRFCMHDGPGVRTTVFFKGCPLRCAWCHNPETQSVDTEIMFYKNKCILCGECVSCPKEAHLLDKEHIYNRSVCIQCGKCAEVCPTNALEICGNDFTVDEVLKIIEKDRAFYGQNGGVTLSGGEPMLQSDDALTLLKVCKSKGINTAVETCGFFPQDIISKVTPFVDLFLWDIKDTDDQRHKAYTGVSNKQIIENLIYADSKGARTRLRCIMVNGVNTDEKHYNGICEIAKKLRFCEGVELILYHPYGGAKNEALNKVKSGNNSWIPSEKQLKIAESFLIDRGVNVIL